MGLSKDRAMSVANYLTRQGVSRDRLVIEGYGEDQPVASNETSYGREQNRRVEVAIYASEDLIDKAESGVIEHAR